MKRTVIAVVALVVGLWVAAHYPDLAWVGVVGLVIALVLGGSPAKSKKH